MPETYVGSTTAILTSIVRKLVSKPGDVWIDTVYADGTAALTLSVSPEDLAAVVGPDGRTGRSLSTIVAALAKKSGIAISLQIRSNLA